MLNIGYVKGYGMKNSITSKFVALVNELQATPDNHSVQQKLVHCLPEMKALASENPLALFHLAKIYPPKSPEYRNTIRQSANKGCTNAMLELCTLLIASGKRDEIKTAAHFIKKIKHSNDTHIYNLSKKLVQSHPELANALHEQSSTQTHGFFSKRGSNPIESMKQSDYSKSP